MEPFQGQISMMAFDYAPRDWAACDGSILPINQNQALFSLIGDTFGGDGRTTMALPDLRGRAALHQGNEYRRGYLGGLERTTVSQATMASHSHGWQANSKQASSPSPTANVLAAPVVDKEIYSPGTATSGSMANSMGDAGGNQSHDNMQPFQVINFCIALQGLYPSRS